MARHARAHGKAQPGAMHDAKAWHESGPAAIPHGRLHATAGPGGYTDTDYIGIGLCVPAKKPQGQTLTASAHEFNKMIAAQRASVERVIAHLKNWRVLSSGYRGLLERFGPSDAVTKLENLSNLVS